MHVGSLGRQNITSQAIHQRDRICQSNPGWGAGKLLEYRQMVIMPKYKDKWQPLFGNKISRLMQGMPA